ncbi:hypothetical protein SEVIR_2G010400v4 [Setaria viridis]|uniref:Uncharacterized protein n=1 Tax=Setaria viridis TaxID=4556 RepID=A0A4U6VKD3_SETVI|nr:hypothetical protein SEVIR_2G010400v2 [Setaria viridis]
MPRALAAAAGGVASAAGFGPILGVALLSVWVISLAVLLCGDSSEETPAQRAERRNARASGSEETTHAQRERRKARPKSSSGAAIGANGYASAMSYSAAADASAASNMIASFSSSNCSAPTCSAPSYC